MICLAFRQAFEQTLCSLEYVSCFMLSDQHSDRAIVRDHHRVDQQDSKQELLDHLDTLHVPRQVLLPMLMAQLLSWVSKLSHMHA